MKKNYFQHKSRVINANNTFTHVMAIALDPKTNFTTGVIRCIASRQGDLAVKGTIDRSELHKISGRSLEHFIVRERLDIKNELEGVQKISGKRFECIGFEDPDIFVDEKKSYHLYFTVALIGKIKNGESRTHLGHAVGKNLDSLKMTVPVLMGNGKFGAKELSIAPLNRKGLRYNLVESADIIDGVYYSVVKVAIAKDMGKVWKFGETVFHPKEHKLAWIAGHASPGPLFPKSFIDVGEGKMLGIMNGCEANKQTKGKTKYGTFSVGLFIYDYEKGKIDWVSKRPFIKDTEAGKGGHRAITFASQFVETKKGEGILYAHVDDSFVRAYTLNAKKIRMLLPKQ